MIRLTPPEFHGCEACRPEDFLACRSCGLQNIERSKPDPASLGAFAALTPKFIAEFSALRKRLAEALTALLKEGPIINPMREPGNSPLALAACLRTQRGAPRPVSSLLNCTAI